MSLYETPNWSVEKEFNCLLDGFQLEGSTSRRETPAGAEELEIHIWNLAVEKKEQELRAAGVVTDCSRSDCRLSLKARKPGQTAFGPAMVPGIQYRLVTAQEIGAYLRKQLFVVEPCRFTELFALQNPEFRRLYTDAGLPLPHGPLAVVVYIKVYHNGKPCFLATVRGKGTPKYPGGIWGVGGDIDDPHTSLPDFLIEKELNEELVFPGQLSYPQAVALIFDKVLGKHDLVCTVKIACDTSNIRKGERYLADVDSLTTIPCGEWGLAAYVAHHFFPTTDPADPRWVGNPTAACSAGLFSVGTFLHGDEWAKQVLEVIGGKAAG